MTVNVSSEQMAAIIDELFESDDRELVVQVNGKAPITLKIEEVRLGETTHDR